MPRRLLLLAIGLAAIVLLGQLRGVGEFGTVLEVPSAGTRAALLDDGSPVFVVADGDDEVTVLDARVEPDAGGVGALVGWCARARRFVEPHGGVVYETSGRFDPAGTAVLGSGAGSRDPLGALGRETRRGLRPYRTEGTAAGALVRVGEAQPPLPPDRSTTGDDLHDRDLAVALDGCSPPEVARFLPLASELERARLPGLKTHATMARRRLADDGLTIVDGLLERPGHGPARLCVRPADVEAGCPRSAPPVEQVPATGVDAAPLTISGPWLVARDAGVVTGLWRLPTTEPGGLGQVEPLEGVFVGFVLSQGLVELRLRHTIGPSSPAAVCLDGADPQQHLPVDPGAVLLGGAALSGSTTPVRLSPQELAGAAFGAGDGPIVRAVLDVATCRVVHLAELDA